jgi:hypothetical protein
MAELTFTKQQTEQLLHIIRKAGRAAVRDKYWSTLSERRKEAVFFWYLKQELNKLPKKITFKEKLMYWLFGEKHGGV